MKIELSELQIGFIAIAFTYAEERCREHGLEKTAEVFRRTNDDLMEIWKKAREKWITPTSEPASTHDSVDAGPSNGSANTPE